MDVPAGDAHGIGVRMVADLDLGFSDLVRAYQDAVFSVALRMSGCRSDADDLTAETFLRAYRVLRGYDDQRLTALRPRPWLMTILLNLWRNTTRDRGRRPRQVPLEHSMDLAAPGPSVEELTVLTDGERRLAALISTLPPVQRKAVVLRHVAGFSVAEISEVLGCSEGTVKSHISRGLTRLRAIDLGAPGRRPGAEPTARSLGTTGGGRS